MDGVERGYEEMRSTLHVSILNVGFHISQYEWLWPELTKYVPLSLRLPSPVPFYSLSFVHDLHFQKLPLPRPHHALNPISRTRKDFSYNHPWRHFTSHYILLGTARPRFLPSSRFDFVCTCSGFLLLLVCSSTPPYRSLDRSPSHARLQPLSPHQWQRLIASRAGRWER